MSVQLRMRLVEQRTLSDSEGIEYKYSSWIVDNNGKKRVFFVVLKKSGGYYVRKDDLSSLSSYKKKSRRLFSGDGFSYDCPDEFRMLKLCRSMDDIHVLSIMRNQILNSYEDLDCVIEKSEAFVPRLTDLCAQVASSLDAIGYLREHVVFYSKPLFAYTIR